MSKLLNIPGGAQLWRVREDNTVWIVYEVPNTKPPVPMIWHIKSGNDLKALFGPNQPIKFDKTITRAQLKKTGAVKMGTRAELKNESLHPFEVFLDSYKKEAQIRPWLRDTEILALVSASILENRSVTEAELKTTEWWQKRSESERQWLVLAEGDPETAKEKVADGRRVVERALIERGIESPPRRLIELLGDRLTTGMWSQSMIQSQIEKLADPFAPGTLSPEVMDALERSYSMDPTGGDEAARRGGRQALLDRARAIFVNRNVPIATPDETEDERLNRIATEIEGGRTFQDLRKKVDQIARTMPEGRPGGQSGLDTTRRGEDKVEELVTRWLGPVHGAWSDTQVAQWAGRFRNDPDAEQELIDLLKQQRLALYPEYENPNLTYEDIVSPWRNFFTQQWGQMPNDDDAILQKVIRMNDATKAEELLRREGLNRGVPKVALDFQGDLLRAFQGQVTGSALT